MDRIEVNKDALVKYVTQNCPHYFYNYAEGECCRRKVQDEMCRISTFAFDLHCPDDCPRLTTRGYGCDKERCAKVKSIIKELKK